MIGLMLLGLIMAVAIPEAFGDRALLFAGAYVAIQLTRQVVLVAGIVVSAVGDELVIAHPGHELATAELVALIAGPVLYLVAQGLMRLRARGDVSATRAAGVVGCLLVGAIGQHVSALATAGLLLLVLVAVIASEERRAAHRGRPAV